jgi:hypothetical protein
MVVTNEQGSTVYQSGEYSVEVVTGDQYGGGIYAKHNCPAATPGREYIHALLPHEIENQKCSRCGKINMPEELRTLYILFRAGRGDYE